ncbi:phosphotransferase [Planomonospora sp. ID82291]|uniref:phosphotransferase n=1 Tax=Planomonospora sp. ID82291 TaxID=2738136 RepID=UPI0018C44C33|nr:phosphotransferase [Planomonospora sp. ID82291]
MITDGTSEVQGAFPEGPYAGDLRRIGEEFGLGEVQDTAFLAEGLMNRNWRIATSTGVYALKLLCDVPVEIVRRNAEVLNALASAGLPVRAPVNTRDGGTVLEIDSRNYLVSPWEQGAHVEGTDLPLTEVADLGALVATIHQVLGDQDRVPLPRAQTRPHVKVTSPGQAIDKADRLLGVIDAIAEPSEFDILARHLLEERKVLIDKHRACPPAEGQTPGPFGWTHGDLQYRNILRRDGKVTAVLDWDRIAVKPLGEEIARTAQVQFGGERGQFDLERVAAFVTGYRTVMPVSRADLVDAVDRLWWKRMSDYWILEFHYDRDDHGPDSLMEPSERLLTWWTDRRGEVEQAFAAGA